MGTIRQSTKFSLNDYLIIILINKRCTITLLTLILCCDPCVAVLTLLLSFLGFLVWKWFGQMEVIFPTLTVVSAWLVPYPPPVPTTWRGECVEVQFHSRTSCRSFLLLIKKNSNFLIAADLCSGAARLWHSERTGVFPPGGEEPEGAQRSGWDPEQSRR